MKRSIVAVALAAVCVAGAGCERRELARTGLVKVGAHTWALIASGPTSAEGLGANSGFIVGREGVVVVDTRHNPALARELLDRIRSVTDAPIRYVVNTHYHQDHTWGNSVFKEQGAAIVATAETRDAFERYSPIYLDYYRGRGPEAFAPLKDVRFAPPDMLITGEARLDLGNVAVELRHFGAGHTAGDVVVFVPTDRVAFTGGLLNNGYHPNLADPGADFENWIRTLGYLEETDARLFVPAQGLVCGKNAISAVRSYIESLRGIAADGIAKRYPLDEVAQTTSLPETEGWLQPNLLPFNVQAVYRKEIPRIVNPRFTLDLPPEYVILDGGGSPQVGYIRWGSQSDEGYFEIEVQWKAGSSGELIVQDITEAVGRYTEQGQRIMTIDTARRMEFAGEAAVAAFGAWKATELTGEPGGGRWSWFMIQRGGRLYVIQCATEAAFMPAKEKRNIAELERIAATFRSKD